MTAKYTQVVAVDFDGTCVFHKYPYTGEDVPGAAAVLHALVKAKHVLILLTMRGDRKDAFDPLTGKNVLATAVSWFESHGLPLFGVNENPSQSSWTSSHKVYANAYIDDAAVGCPLVEYALCDRPAVNWPVTALNLALRGLLPFYYAGSSLSWPGRPGVTESLVKPTHRQYLDFMQEHATWNL